MNKNANMPPAATPATTEGQRFLRCDAVVTIDGPAGSGKSSTARDIAARSGLLYIDTGAMYRALAWAGRGAGLDPGAGTRLAELLRSAHLELCPGRRDLKIVWDGQDITSAIRTPEIDSIVSQVSAHADVRREMVERQRALGRSGGVVMEGRDIGSVVFPLATAKIYLDASLDARADRRFRQYRSQGQTVDQQWLRQELAARDQQDSQRTESPLTIPPDAVVLDTSNWRLAEQNDRTWRAVLDLAAEQVPGEVVPQARRENLTDKYRFAYGCMRTAARFFGLRVYGREYLDSASNAILACNHVSWWDPPLVGSTLQRCPVHTLAKAELFRMPPLGAFFRFLDAVPIQRRIYDQSAFGTAISVLAAGGNIFIFPEGTRRPIGRPGPVRSGLGTLMQATLAPAVPIFIRGSRRLEVGGSSISPLEVHFAPAVKLRALPALRQRYDKRAISKQIGRLFEAVYGELQARSFATRPQTAWEREEGLRQDKAYRNKERLVFGRWRGR